MYYTGHTSNLEDRLERHNKGENTYTRPGRPVVLVTFVAFSDDYKAYDFDKYHKSGSGKALAQKHLL
jgi:putative endonuclease